jgi:predicted enzyme related to lactoylglutathione lyase
MATLTSHAPGTFCWPELYTTDQQGAKAFYAGLFGWEIKDIPMGPDAAYTIFTLGGREAAACYGAMPGMEKQGIPPHWMAYVSVTSADEAAAAVKGSGGAALKEPFDVMGIGRMAALRDPGGAAFCVWQAKGHTGVAVLGEPGALMWTELLASDTDRASAFYASVFGWSRKPWPMADGSTYHLFLNGEAPAGGMIAITAAMGGVRPAWVSYFQAENCDVTAARCAELGGQVSMPPQDVPEVGRFAVLVDSAGAHFGIMQPRARG